jgi:hypothetical protein
MTCPSTGGHDIVSEFPLCFASGITTTAALSAVCNQGEWVLHRFWFGNPSNVLDLRFDRVQASVRP